MGTILPIDLALLPTVSCVCYATTQSSSKSRLLSMEMRGGSLHAIASSKPSQRNRMQCNRMQSNAIEAKPSRTANRKRRARDVELHAEPPTQPEEGGPKNTKTLGVSRSLVESSRGQSSLSLASPEDRGCHFRPRRSPQTRAHSFGRPTLWI